MDSDSRKSERAILKQHLKNASFFLLLGIAYYIWLRITGIGIPCIFHKITGWSCPGCGMTTLIMSLLAGDPAGARAANPFIFYTWPVIAAEFIWSEIKAIKGLNRDQRPLIKNTDRIFNIILIIYIAALVIFGILRNIP
jgi:hypothetical protein